MNLCIDVGNSTVALGLFNENALEHRFIHNNEIHYSEDECVSLIKKDLEFLNVNEEAVEKIIYSSVVPSVNHPFIDALKKIFQKKILLIAPGIKTGLSLKVDNPNEIGNDLIADLVGAKLIGEFPCLIVDCGTATKILLLDKTGSFTSCLIHPGLSLSARSLSSKAALLPDVSLSAPQTVLAKNTIDAMNAGLVFGHTEMIKGLVERYESELGYPCQHILTGGCATFLKDQLPNYKYVPELNLIGLNNLILRNGDFYD